MRYFGPSCFAGARSSIGSGLSWNAAGKKPASIATWPSAVCIDSPLPPSTIVLPRPGPEIDAWSGPFAAAVTGRARAASSTSTNERRFIFGSFRMAAATTPRGARWFPCVSRPLPTCWTGRRRAPERPRRNPNASPGVGPAVVDRPLDETGLVELARRGDLRAWETIVRAHQGIAFRTAYLLCGSSADAEEAVQDAFVKAYRALGRFRR